jgi:hypothetical protein
MIRAMHLRHRLAALIWAAAFVVAAQFVAGAALAHGEHSHQHHHHSPTVHASAGQVQQSGAVSSEIRLVQWQQSARTFAATILPEHAACTPGGCIGNCCSAGIGCCGAALVGTFSPLPDVSRIKETTAVIFVRRSGIDPEALARPPRPLA